KYNINTEAGSSTTPTVTSYLRANVTGLSGTVVSASLQLYSYSTSTVPLTAWTTDGSWTETGVTYATAPPLGTKLGSDSNLKLNTWTAVDVTGALTGNGTVNLALTDARTSVDKFGSRESLQPPRLVITTISGSTSPATSPPTSTTTAPTSSTSSPAATATTSSSTPSSTSSSTPSSAPSGPTIVAAGDIACTSGKATSATACQQLATSNLAMQLKPDALLPLGDDQYEYGTLSDFQTMYGPTWGRMNSIARPIPGNHEYGYVGSTIQPTGGEGYFTYFGDRSHPLDPGCTINCTSWYSYDIGSWHVVALDSQCGVIGGCNPGNPEYQWLLSDLNAHPAKCTLAYWHIPLYASSHDRQPDMQSIYSLLYSKGADVVLTGHAHYYERFAPQNASGVADPAKGVREFVVGTGGRSFFNLGTTQANSEFRLASTFGVLQMTLSDGSYSWNFVTAGGATADSGTTACH
ncbi:MAG: CBM96 family carbohydrate-binding protein, partial [Actinomycetes bacterium]